MIGRIYRIECNLNGKFYVGSTTQTLAKRLKNHRSKSKEECRKKTPLYACFNECGWDHASIRLISEHNDISNEQLLAIEKEEIIKCMDDPMCLNKSRPQRTPEELKTRSREYGRTHRENNKDKDRERVSQWRLMNPDKWKEQTKRYREKKNQGLSDNHAAI